MTDTAAEDRSEAPETQVRDCTVELTELTTALLPACVPPGRMTRTRGGQWRQVVLAHARSLAGEVLAACEGEERVAGTSLACRAEAARIAQLLRTAACVASVPSTPINWWDGRLYEQAWLNLHEAEASLCRLLPEPELRAHGADVLASARDALGANDERVKVLTDRLASSGDRPNGGSTASLCRTVEHVARATYRASDDAYAQSRGFRNRLIRLTALALVAVGAMSAVAAAWLDFGLPEPQSGWVAPAIIGVFGVIGALITAIPSVARVQGTRNPFNLPLYQLLLKLVMGPLFALVGVLLVRTGVIDPDALFGQATVVSSTTPDVTESRLALWAVLFGGAQHVVTWVVDRRVASLVAPMDGDNDTSARRRRSRR